MSAKKLQEARRFYAEQMAAASQSADPRLERAFELVPREAFLPPGPWRIKVDPRYVETPSADPVFLYQNSLVAIDVPRGINNGEPFLHAAWIGALAPQAGEVVCHIGALARDNLEPFENVSVTHGDATRIDLPACDLIYVNAGVVAPPPSWLKALRPGGRMIFPWRPATEIGLTILVRRSEQRFAVKPLMPSWFIPCVGASSGEVSIKPPTGHGARSARSIWLAADKSPDDTAAAVYKNLWFSSAPSG